MASRIRSVLDVSVTLLMGAAAVMMLTGSRARPAKSSKSAIGVPQQPQPLADAHVLGDTARAQVAIIEYTDFQCPFCARFTKDSLPQLKRQYIETGKVLLAFRHLPLKKIHASAEVAAQTAECAARAGHFWEAHDQLFINAAASRSDVLRAALLRQAGLSEPAAAACVPENERAHVEHDMQTAKALGISATPTFLVGPVQADGQVGVKYVFSGVGALSEMSKALDKLTGTR